jgi:hypothetical protein
MLGIYITINESHDFAFLQPEEKSLCTCKKHETNSFIKSPFIIKTMQYLLIKPHNKSLTILVPTPIIVRILLENGVCFVELRSLPNHLPLASHHTHE